MEWKAIKGYEGFYEISEAGDVRSLPRKELQPGRVRFGKDIEPFYRFREGKQLKFCLSKDKYSVELFRNDSEQCGHRKTVHRLVYAAFVNDLIEGYVIHHVDLNPLNNHYTNLQQMSYTEHNNIHSHTAWNKGISNPKSMVENARKARKKNYIKRCELVKQMKDSGMVGREIAEELDISTRQVYSRLKSLREFKMAA